MFNFIVNFIEVSYEDVERQSNTFRFFFNTLEPIMLVFIKVVKQQGRNIFFAHQNIKFRTTMNAFPAK